MAFNLEIAKQTIKKNINFQMKRVILKKIINLKMFKIKKTPNFKVNCPEVNLQNHLKKTFHFQTKLIIVQHILTKITKIKTKSTILIITIKTAIMLILTIIKIKTIILIIIIILTI